MAEADNRTLGQKVADTVAWFGGSWYFIISFSLVLVLWVFINTLAFFDWFAWDKPPYILLNLLLSFIAAFQAPFIMMSQNRAEAKQDAAYRILFQEVKDLVQQDIEQTLAHQSLLKLIEVHEKRSSRRLAYLFRLLAEKKIKPGMKIDLDNPPREEDTIIGQETK